MGVHLFLIFIPATVMSVVWNDIPRTFPNRSFSNSLSFPYKMNTGLTLNFISAVLYMPRTTGCYFGVQTDHICLDTSLVSLRKHKFQAIIRKAIVKNSSTMFCVSLSSQFFLFKELTKCFLKWIFFFTPTTNTWCLQIFHILANTFYYIFKIFNVFKLCACACEHIPHYTYRTCL